MKSLLFFWAAAMLAQTREFPPCPALPEHSHIIDPGSILNEQQRKHLEREIRMLPYVLYVYTPHDIPNYFISETRYAAADMLRQCLPQWKLAEYGNPHAMVLLVGTKQRQWATVRGEEVHSLAPSFTLQKAFMRFYTLQAKSPYRKIRTPVPALYEGLVEIVQILRGDAPEKK